MTEIQLYDLYCQNENIPDGIKNQYEKEIKATLLWQAYMVSNAINEAFESIFQVLTDIVQGIHDALDKQEEKYGKE